MSSNKKTPVMETVSVPADNKNLSVKIPKFTEMYKELYTECNDKFHELQEKRAEFPAKFLETTDFEEFTLQASNLKHEAILLNKAVLTTQVNSQIDLKYYEALVLFYSARDILKDFGFSGETNALMTSAVASNKELNELKKVVGLIDALQEAVKTLPKAFETDETNYRVFSSYKHKLGGF